MVIVLFFDDKYFHFAKPLLTSISIHEPEVKTYIHAFNLSTEQLFELGRYPTSPVIATHELEFDPNVADEYHKGLNKGKPLRFQLTCQRGRYLLDAMEYFEYEDLFIISDVDTLMIKPLSALKIQMKGYDVGVVRVSDTKICSGFFAVNNTYNAKKYLTTFYDTAMDGRLFLCKDQKTMAKIHERMKDKINFLYLDRRYLDHECSNDSFMWSGHKSYSGSKQEKYERYLKKLETMT